MTEAEKDRRKKADKQKQTFWGSCFDEFRPSGQIRLALSIFLTASELADGNVSDVAQLYTDRRENWEGAGVQKGEDNASEASKVGTVCYDQNSQTWKHA